MKKSIKSIFAIILVYFQFSAHALWALDEIPNQDIAESTGELLVKFSPSSQKKNLDQALLQKYDLKVLKKINYPYANYALVRSNFNKTKLKTVELQSRLMSEDSSIEYIEPNYIYKINKTISTMQDPDFNKLWGLLNTGKNEPAGSRGHSSAYGKVGVDINATKAWNITKGHKNVKIAIIDTGIDYNHEDLKYNIWTNLDEASGMPGVDDDGNGYVDDIHGYDFANHDGDPMDGNGHGTHVAGTIGAQHDNGIGVAGVMGEVQMIGVKFLTDEGAGTTVNAIEAINYAIKMDVDIMNNSWGGGGFSTPLKEAIAFAGKKGILFTAAAGNSSDDNDLTPTYPSSYKLDNIISVAAHNYSEKIASFSCYGASSVDIAAPGENIYSTIPKDGYAVYSGTSMATPHITGVLGLYIALNGRTGIQDIKNALLNSSVYVPNYDRVLVSAGRVDTYNFLAGVYPSRPETPDQSQWKDYDISLFETAHPYFENENFSNDYSIPGAKFVRAIVKKLELENGYDFLNILNESGEKIQALTGSLKNHPSEYVRGDTIRLHFQSDNSVQQWGVVVEKIQYID